MRGERRSQGGDRSSEETYRPRGRVVEEPDYHESPLDSPNRERRSPLDSPNRERTGPLQSTWPSSTLLRDDVVQLNSVFGVFYAEHPRERKEL